MKEKTFKNLEIAGAIITVVVWFLLHKLNSLECDHLINVIFGSVNHSVWESLKIFLLACLLWSGIEMCWAKPYFRRFVVVKTISIYGGIFFYGGIVTLLQIGGLRINKGTEAAFMMVFSILFHTFSYKFMMKKPKVQGFFVPCIFMLLLFSVVFVCFTPFPPKIPLFMDFENGLYGIIPPNFDKGAIFLDSLYGN